MLGTFTETGLDTFNVDLKGLAGQKLRRKNKRRDARKKEASKAEKALQKCLKSQA